MRIAKECQRSAKSPAIMALRVDSTKSDRSDCSRKSKHYFPFYEESKSHENGDGWNIPELGGYDYEFQSKVPENCKCLVCHLTLKDPVQIVGCGHRLCNFCMESLLR